MKSDRGSRKSLKCKEKCQYLRFNHGSGARTSAKIPSPGNSERLALFTRNRGEPDQCCKGLTGYANVLAPTGFTLGLFWEVFMKKLVAMVFFAMVAGNAMAQAGGASSGAGAAGGGGAAGATAGVVATAAAAVAGVAAASSNNSNSPNH
jgi:hypothetical protein